MLLLTADGSRVVVTAHALHRYRARLNQRRASEDAVERVLSTGRVGLKPGWAQQGLHGLGSDTWLVGSGWACPLRLPTDEDRNRQDIDWVATTCIRRRRLPKQVVRWMRAQADEDAQAA